MGTPIRSFLVFLFVKYILPLSQENILRINVIVRDLISAEESCSVEPLALHYF